MCSLYHLFKIIEDWKVFSKIFPESDDAEAYCAENPQEIPLFSELFGPTKDLAFSDNNFSLNPQNELLCGISMPSVQITGNNRYYILCLYI